MAYRVAAFQAGMVFRAVRASQPGGAISGKMQLGGFGTYGLRPLSNQKVDVIHIVGSFLQKQPAGFGGIPVPAVIIHTAVGNVVHRLKE